MCTWHKEFRWSIDYNVAWSLRVTFPKITRWCLICTNTQTLVRFRFQIVYIDIQYELIWPDRNPFIQLRCTGGSGTTINKKTKKQKYKFGSPCISLSFCGPTHTTIAWRIHTSDEIRLPHRRNGLNRTRSSHAHLYSFVVSVSLCVDLIRNSLSHGDCRSSQQQYNAFCFYFFLFSLYVCVCLCVKISQQQCNVRSFF